MFVAGSNLMTFRHFIFVSDLNFDYLKIMDETTSHGHIRYETKN